METSMYLQVCIEKAKSMRRFLEPIPFLKRQCGMCRGLFIASGIENYICPACLSQWNAGEISLEVF